MKEGDFIEINYTGKTKEGFPFDTTYPDVAKKVGMNAKQTYKPIIICLGQGQLIEGLDKAFVGKDIGKHTFEIKAEDAFGKKDPKKIQLVSTSKFKKEGLNPYPGMQVNIDNTIAVVKRVSGGRTLVDFNHPLSGMDVEYEVEVIREVTDLKEKVESYIQNTYGNIKFDLKGTEVTLHVQQEVPDEIKKMFNENFAKILPEITKVEFTVEKSSETKEEREE